LRAVITNHGGPAMKTSFNLYYLHWWTLTHFVFESPRCREHALELTQQGGTIEAFEQLLGPAEAVQTELHAYVRDLKARRTGSHFAP